MAATIDHEQRIKNYFTAWMNHDIDLLRTIFSPSAKYIIRRKTTYSGIEEITKYWKRNKNRQKNLQLHWKSLVSSYYCEVVEFGAYFWDLENNQYTKVNGQIIFKYDTNNQIICLTESYKVRTINKNLIHESLDATQDTFSSPQKNENKSLQK